MTTTPGISDSPIGNTHLSARTPKTPNPFTTTTGTSTPRAANPDISLSVQSSFHNGAVSSAASIEPHQLDALQHTFPPASAFTFLPDLHNVITRLRLLEGTPEFKGSGAATGANPNAPTSSPLLNRSDPTLTTLTPSEAIQEIIVSEDDSNNDKASSIKPIDPSSATTNPPVNKPNTSKNNQTNILEVKDLPSQFYEIKQRIQAARELVTLLPDISRTIAEQESEITRLNSQVRGLRKRIGELGSLASMSSSLDGQVKTNVDADRNRYEKTSDIVMQGVEEEEEEEKGFG